MRFTAICHLCGTKQIVPQEFSRNVEQAKKWASSWEDRHMMEVKHEQGTNASATKAKGSETQA